MRYHGTICYDVTLKDCIIIHTTVKLWITITKHDQIVEISLNRLDFRQAQLLQEHIMRVRMRF